MKVNVPWNRCKIQEHFIYRRSTVSHFLITLLKVIKDNQTKDNQLTNLKLYN